MASTNKNMIGIISITIIASIIIIIIWFASWYFWLAGFTMSLNYTATYKRKKKLVSACSCSPLYNFVNNNPKINIRGFIER